MILRCRYCRFERHVPIDLGRLREFLLLDLGAPTEDMRLYADRAIAPNQAAIDEALAEVRQHTSIIHDLEPEPPAELVLQPDERVLWEEAKSYHERRDV